MIPSQYMQYMPFLIRIAVGWVVVAVLIGVFANKQNRNPVVYALLSLVLGPVIPGVILLLSGKSDNVIPKLRRAAKKGDVTAMYALGNTYREKDDSSEAIRWFEEAAGHGHIDSMKSLGSLYRSLGKPDMIVRWYGKAAEQGDADAMIELGNTYCALGLGNSYPIDYESCRRVPIFNRDRDLPEYSGEYVQKTIEAYLKAAELGHSEVYGLIGNLYLSGAVDDGKDREEECRNWYRKAIAAGDSRGAKVYWTELSGLEGAIHWYAGHASGEELKTLADLYEQAGNSEKARSTRTRYYQWKEEKRKEEEAELKRFMEQSARDERYRRRQALRDRISELKYQARYEPEDFPVLFDDRGNGYTPDLYSRVSDSFLNGCYGLQESAAREANEKIDAEIARLEKELNSL